MGAHILVCDGSGSSLPITMALARMLMDDCCGQAVQASPARTLAASCGGDCWYGGAIKALGDLDGDNIDELHVHNLGSSTDVSGSLDKGHQRKCGAYRESPRGGAVASPR